LSFKLGEIFRRQIKAPDCVVGLIAKPDIAVRAGRDAHAHAEEGKLKLRDFARGSHPRDRTGRTFAEPHIAIGPDGNECGVAQAGCAKAVDLAPWGDDGHLAAVRECKPEVPVRRLDDVKWSGAGADWETPGFGLGHERPDRQSEETDCDQEEREKSRTTRARRRRDIVGLSKLFHRRRSTAPSHRKTSKREHRCYPSLPSALNPLPSALYPLPSVLCPLSSVL